MSGLELLQSVRFVSDSDGRPSAVQIDIETWESLLDWLEELEDRTLVKELLPRLRQGPEKAEALSWETARAAWFHAEPEDEAV